MSTAIMHQTAYYDFGDLLLKSQNQTRSNGNVVSGGGIQSIANTTNNNVIGGAPSGSNKNYSVSLSHNGAPPQHSLLQQQLIVAAAQQHQQQHNHKMILHSALQRAVSHPHGAAGAAANGANVATFVNTIIENLGGHRKLERTQSEPLPQVNTSRYKTELCRPFEEAGECKYGDKCQFAHGMYELRNLQRHPKYKTELCRTFHSVGYCPYGPRCHFVHNAEEARLGVQNQQNSVALQQQRLVLLNRGGGAAAAMASGQLGGALPLSPALSMSTGSDRASPTGSLSPTNSVPSFLSAGDIAASPAVDGPLMAHAIFPSSGFMAPPPQPPSLSPPQSPHELSPVATPPPELETRLPVFNRLSSTIDSLNNLAI
ncbi:protein TIS11 [Phlebotomus argentipes]|uniref:protein TIS11 n=1 Tax=Phlebotomus argentipes TaxID=94469 RepID=UPI002892F979|nr:protein TIS11 [Phlebotomus argentipes]